MEKIHQTNSIHAMIARVGGHRVDTSSGVTPIFVLSLPRSGSTLLQNILGSHKSIATADEPWILLPLLYGFKGRGVFAEYDHYTSVIATKKFLDSIDKGHIHLKSGIADVARSLYQNAVSGEEEYFLDKTPRYSLIADEIIEMFPDAKFVVLWRNPLAVVSSMISTWSGINRWKLGRFQVDLYEGMENLNEFAYQYDDSVLQINYEDLVGDPADITKKVCEYIGIEFDPDMLNNVNRCRESGEMGDKTGYTKYEGVEDSRLHEWEFAFCTPVRIAWAKRYIKWLGAERLSRMGYNHEGIVEKLESSKSGSLVTLVFDCLFVFYDKVYSVIPLNILKRQLDRLVKGKRCYPPL